jgi:hypothetical protein
MDSAVQADHGLGLRVSETIPAGLADSGSPEGRAEREHAATLRLEAALATLAARDNARFERVIGRRSGGPRLR